MLPFVIAPIGAAGGVSSSTWNLADKAVNAVLSGGNKIVNSSSGVSAARGTLSWGSGKRYFTVTVGTINANDFVGAGLAKATAALTGTHFDANADGFENFGGNWVVVSNGGVVAINTAASASGDTLNIAWNGTTGDVFFGVNGTYYSSAGAATGNPGTGANPTITGLTGTLFPIGRGASGSPSANVTLNTLPTGVPSGYVQWT